MTLGAVHKLRNAEGGGGRQLCDSPIFQHGY